MATLGGCAAHDRKQTERAQKTSQEMKSLLKLREMGMLDNRHIDAARFFKAKHSEIRMAPTIRRILEDAIIGDMAINEIEAKYGWPARSAKAVIATLLDIISEAKVTGRYSHPDPDDGLIEYLTATDFDHELFGLMDRYGLTVMEARTLVLMLRAPGRAITAEALHAKLYADNPDPPDIKIHSVRISFLRKKIARDYTITSYINLGWKLVEAGAGESRKTIATGKNITKMTEKA